MAELLYDKDLTVIIDEPVDCEHVESVLAQVLLDRGLVRDTYAQAIADRREELSHGARRGRDLPRHAPL